MKDIQNENTELKKLIEKFKIELNTISEKDVTKKQSQNSL